MPHQGLLSRGKSQQGQGRSVKQGFVSLVKRLPGLTSTSTAEVPRRIAMNSSIPGLRFSSRLWIRFTAARAYSRTVFAKRFCIAGVDEARKPVQKL